MNTAMKKTVIATTLATFALGSVATYAAIEGRVSREDRQAEMIQVMETAPESIQTIFASSEADRTSLSQEDRETLKAYIQENTDLDVSHESRKGKGKQHPKIDIENAPEEIQAISAFLS